MRLCQGPDCVSAVWAESRSGSYPFAVNLRKLCSRAPGWPLGARVADCAQPLPSIKQPRRSMKRHLPTDPGLSSRVLQPGLSRQLRPRPTVRNVVSVPAACSVVLLEGGGWLRSTRFQVPECPFERENLHHKRRIPRRYDGSYG